MLKCFPGVPQLSLGEKAVLTATADFVRPTPCRPLIPSHNSPVGIRLARLPSCDPAKFDAEVRGRAPQDQLSGRLRMLPVLLMYVSRIGPLFSVLSM